MGRNRNCINTIAKENILVTLKNLYALMAIVFALFLIGITLAAVMAMRDSPNVIMEVVAENFVFRGNNPTLYTEPGSQVNLIFRNEARGINHQLAIEGLDVETDVLRPGESQEINFFVPLRDTVFTYSCYLHPTMKGKFVVGSSPIREQKNGIND